MLTKIRINCAQPFDVTKRLHLVFCGKIEICADAGDVEFYDSYGTYIAIPHNLVTSMRAETTN